MKRGGNPADIYYDYDAGIIYVLDRDGILFPLVGEVEEGKVDLKIEEGYQNFGSKIEFLDDVLKRMNTYESITY